MEMLTTTAHSNYSVLVCPHLEYAAPIWDSHFIKDTNNSYSLPLIHQACAHTNAFQSSLYLSSSVSV